MQNIHLNKDFLIRLVLTLLTVGLTSNQLLQLTLNTSLFGAFGSVNAYAECYQSSNWLKEGCSPAKICVAENSPATWNVTNSYNYFDYAGFGIGVLDYVTYYAQSLPANKTPTSVIMYAIDPMVNSTLFLNYTLPPASLTYQYFNFSNIYPLYTATINYIAPALAPGDTFEEIEYNYFTVLDNNTTIDPGNNQFFNYFFTDRAEGPNPDPNNDPSTYGKSFGTTIVRIEKPNISPTANIAISPISSGSIVVNSTFGDAENDTLDLLYEISTSPTFATILQSQTYTNPSGTSHSHTFTGLDETVQYYVRVTATEQNVQGFCTGYTNETAGNKFTTSNVALNDLDSSSSSSSSSSISQGSSITGVGTVVPSNAQSRSNGINILSLPNQTSFSSLSTAKSLSSSSNTQSNLIQITTIDNSSKPEVTTLQNSQKNDTQDKSIDSKVDSKVTVRTGGSNLTYLLMEILAGFVLMFGFVVEMIKKPK